MHDNSKKYHYRAFHSWDPDSIHTFEEYRRYKINLLEKDFMVVLTNEEILRFLHSRDYHEMDRIARQILINRWDDVKGDA